ncbi:MAG: HAMP domain-containing histidine kinase [Deltaproteobacteria bacterium]|jgi:signal transduction histidine kinase|nr:HAMP domain-containing histidine kinase [Deltaproteobacteria bacterium]
MASFIAAKIKEKLWRKIFLFSFLTIFVCQILTLAWYQYGYNQEKRAVFLIDYVLKMTDKIKDLTEDELKRYFELYGVEQEFMWLESSGGDLLLGRPAPGMSSEERSGLKVRARYGDDDAALLFLQRPEPSMLALIKSRRSGEVVYFCSNWWQGGLVDYWNAFAQGVIGLIGLSLLLSLWTARRISKPLQSLQKQVVTIAEGQLDLRLSEAGEDEVADVSRAVNKLTYNLSQNIKGMRMFITNISHEIRSTVTSLTMCLEFLEEAVNSLLSKDKNHDSERIELNLRQARQEIDLLQNMVDSGLLSGKLDLDQERVDQNPLDLSSVCRDVIARHALHTASKELILNSDIKTDLWMFGDEMLMDRLLANVIDNALKYTAAGGEITIRLGDDDDGMIFTCLNTHPPLADEQLSSLCLPFYRADSDHVYGSGLGLYLVRKIADIHKGKFNIENNQGGILLSIVFPKPSREDLRSLV